MIATDTITEELAILQDFARKVHEMDAEYARAFAAIQRLNAVVPDVYGSGYLAYEWEQMETERRAVLEGIEITLVAGGDEPAWDPTSSDPNSAAPPGGAVAAPPSLVELSRAQRR